jgi:hypothetical protein
LTWDKYHSHDVINEFIDELANTNDWVNTVSIGKTTEGRDLRVIQIAKAGPGKPNVFIDAGKYFFLITFHLHDQTKLSKMILCLKYRFF